MNKEEVFTKVKKLIAEGLNIEEAKIQLTSNLAEDFGADSLDAIELICVIEDEFGITIEDEDAVKFKTVSDIVDCICK